MTECQTDHHRSEEAAYLVVWPDGEEEWRCKPCFDTDIRDVVRYAEAFYYLPTCAQLDLVVREGRHLRGNPWNWKKHVEGA